MDSYHAYSTSSGGLSPEEYARRNGYREAELVELEQDLDSLGAKGCFTEISYLKKALYDEIGSSETIGEGLGRVGLKALMLNHYGEQQNPTLAPLKDNALYYTGTLLKPTIAERAELTYGFKSNERKSTARIDGLITEIGFFALAAMNRNLDAPLTGIGDIERKRFIIPATLEEDSGPRNAFGELTGFDAWINDADNPTMRQKAQWKTTMNPIYNKQYDPSITVFALRDLTPNYPDGIHLLPVDLMHHSEGKKSDENQQRILTARTILERKIADGWR